MIWIFVLLAALTALFYSLSGDTSVLSNLDQTERWLMIGGAVLMSAYAIVLIVGQGGRWSQNIRYAGIWVGIFLALIVVYTFRNEFSAYGNRVATEILPPGMVSTVTGKTEGEIAVRIRRKPNGHFIAQGLVNDTQVVLMVDTGASTVVLKNADASRAGIDTSTLSYTIPVNTANGTAFAAPVRLRSVAVGPIKIDNVEALIAKPGKLNESLLGISFLRRLRSYEFSSDFLTLRG